MRPSCKTGDCAVADVMSIALAQAANKIRLVIINLPAHRFDAPH
jgi:hypothetical protein